MRNRTIAELYEFTAPVVDTNSSLLFNNNRYVGVEWEVENFSRGYQAPDNIRIVPEGSLRDNGMELIFSDPLRGSRMVDAISGIDEALQDQSWTFSDLTSTHIHFDVRDLTVVETGILCTCLAFLEDELYNISSSQSRKNNHFSTPAIKSTQFWGHVLHLTNGSRLTSNPSRYMNVNLASILKFGSIELRHFVGGLDKDTLLRIINLVHRLIDDVVEHQFDIFKNVGGRYNFQQRDELEILLTAQKRGE